MKLNDAFDAWKNNPSEESYEELGKALYRFIQATVAKEFRSHSSTLQDAVGETVVKILSSLSTFIPERGSFAVWVYGITKNACFDMRRAHTYRSEQVFVEAVNGRVKTGYVNKILLQSLVERLLPQDRGLYNYKMLGYENEDIAGKLGITEAAVKMRWARVIERLRTLGGGN